MNHAHISYRTDDEFFAYAFEKWQAAPDNQPNALQQPQFGIVLSHARSYCDDALKREIPGIAELPLQTFYTLTDTVFARALITGLQLYAALTRSGDARPPEASVPAAVLWESAMDRLNQESTECINFTAALRALGPMAKVIDGFARHLLFKIKDAPLVLENLQILYDMTAFNLRLGMALEHACAICESAQKSHDDFVRRLMNEKAGTDIDMDDPHVASRIAGTPLEEMICDDPNVHPWPLDEVCICGHSLSPFIFCCNPAEPFSIAAEVESFRPGHQIHCKSCGAELPGFACDLCGRIYSWQRGVVDSLPSR